MDSQLATNQPSSFTRVTHRNLVEELLRDKRSAATRRTYQKGLHLFFQYLAQQEATPDLVAEFLQLERFTAIGLVLDYKAHLIATGKAEATVNNRLSAIRSLVKYAQRIGKCGWSLEEVEGEKVTTYRDTTGITPAAFKKLFEACDRTTLKGKRDYALLRLLWDNVLRRDEICKLTIGDWQPDDRKLAILGKGKGTQKQSISLSKLCAQAIADWLEARSQESALLIPPAKQEVEALKGVGSRESGALFVSLDRAHFGHPLTGDGLYHLVSEQLAKQAGLTKKFSPHRCRHSGITAALDATNGDVRRVQKLSRHGSLDVLLRYDDNRKNAQGEVTDLLADLAQ